MSAKEIKALVEIGTSMGYTGDDLKQFVCDERMRMDKEKEKEKERAYELEKLKVESEAKATAEAEKAKIAAEAEKAKIAAEAEKAKAAVETERLKIEAEKLKLEAEQKLETEKLKLDAEAEKAKVAAATEAEKLKIEAEKLRIGAEQEKFRMDAEAMKAKMEHECKMREIEIRNRDTGGSGDAEINQNNHGNSAASRSAGMKALKLPPFNEEKDDLDAYLIRFERACTAFEVQQEHRSTQLARLLQGKALDVYQRLADDEVDNYDVLKAQLLKRFRLTEGGYRSKFKYSKLEQGETPAQFAERLKRYLEKWREMAGYEAEYEGLQELILRDQYFSTCEQSMQVFLKEKGKLSLKDMTKESMYFIEAHGYKHEKKTNGSNGKASTNKPNGNNESTGSSSSTSLMW